MALSDEDKAKQVAAFEQFDRMNPKPTGKNSRLPGRPLTPAERRLWAKAKRKVGRPTVGLGSKMIPVSIERGLLDEADAFAKRHKLKRSQMVADALRLFMRTAKAG